MSEKQYVFAKDFFPPLIECVNSGQNVSFRVTGFSMWPLLCHRRDIVILTKCNLENLRLGDIVLFQPNSENYLLHRITKMRENLIQTTGDGNLFRDGWFPKDCVVAQVDSVIRKGKTIPVNSSRWRFIFRVWAAFFPIRKCFLAFLRGIAKIKK